MKKILFILIFALPFAALAQTAKDTVNVVTDAEIAEGTTADTLKMYFIQGGSWKKTRLDSIARYTRVKLAGNKGDITVSGATGDTWSINSGAVTWDDLSQPVKDSISAGGTGGSGTVQSITAGAGLTGGTITVSGTIAADTANVLASKAWTNAGLALKLNISDTTTMLSPYLKEADTTAMLVPYLRKADTSAMLAPYLKIIDTTAMLASYLKIADTTAMLVPYLRKVDTTAMLVPYLRDADTTAMLSSYFRKDKISAEFTIKSPDTLALSQQSAANGQVLAWNGSRWAPASVGGSGTVQSITSGYGLTADVNPITTSGTITVDTSYIVDTFRLKNAINSILTNPMTTQGDIIVAGTSGAPGRLGIGTAGQLLKVNTGATGLEYFTPSYVTGVTGTSPVVSSGGTTPAISLASGYGDTQNPYASKSQNLFLASPNGTSGAPTFRSIAAADVPALPYLSNTASSQTGWFGNVLLQDDVQTSFYLGITNNSGMTNSRTLTLNVNNADRTISMSGNLTVPSAATVSGTNTGDVTIGTANGLSLSNQTLSLATASTSTTGALTSTDYNTFNNKLSSEVDGSVTNEGSLTVLAGASNTSVIRSNTSGSTDVTLTAGNGMTISESGNTITLTNGGVTSVSGTGTVSGITLSGTVTSTGSLTLGGTLAAAPSNITQGGATLGQVLKWGGSQWGPADDATLYSTNGTLSAARTVTMGGNALTFDGSVSDIRINSSGTLESFNSAGTSAVAPTQIYSIANDGFTAIGSGGIGDHAVFFQDGSNLAAMSINASGGLGFRTTTNWATADDVTISASGSVGIGNTSPARTLHVTGEARITDLTTDNPTRLVGADADGDLSGVTLGSGLAFDGTTIKKQEAMVIACSDETTNLTTGTAKVTFRAPFAMTITGVRANVNTAPVGSTIIVDINKGDTPASIFDTRLSIDASEKTSTTAASAAVIASGGGTITDDQQITIDIDQVGSSTAGKGLKVTIYYTR